MSNPHERVRPRRRRPRPFSDHDDDNGADNASGGAKTLGEALSLSTNIQIDTILERRQKEGPPRPEGADACGADDGTSGSEVVDNAGGEDERNGKAVLEEDVAARGHQRPPMTDDEIAETHADVFGRPPPDVARTEERLLTLEIEVRRLPKEERQALTKAMRLHPLLFVNCPHATMLLQQDEADFDAASAARRLARYWECRRLIFGTKECYAPGVFAKPIFAEYKRFYERLRAILNDPRTDEMARQDAEEMLKVIEKTKIEELDKILEEMEEQSKYDFNPEEHDDEAATEAVLDSYARDMATQSPHKLKLQFLRVENMDETLAARRLFRYWQTGLRLFGPCLQQSKRVTLADLEDCSELLFRCCQLRLLPEEDEFGRSILVFRHIISPDGEDNNGNLMSEERMIQLGINEDHFAKVAWYMLHAAMERESCQDYGFVLIFDLRMGDGNFKKRQRHREALKNVQSCVPVKMCASHFLLNPLLSWWKQLALQWLSFAGLSLRQRFVFHVGAMENILERLGGDFGIGVEKLPVDMGGAVEWDYFVRWLEERRDAGL